MTLVRWVAVVAASGVLAAACASGNGSGSQPETTSPSPTAGNGDGVPTTPAVPPPTGSPTPADGPSVAAPPANAQALDWQGRLLDGTPVEGASFAGDPVVLWMWAPWCPNCKREAPDVARIFGEYRDRITFVGLPAKDSIEAMQGFIDTYDLEGMAQVTDDALEISIWRHYGIGYQPAWVFISASGETEVRAGGFYGSGLREKLDALLAS